MRLSLRLLALLAVASVLAGSVQGQGLGRGTPEAPVHQWPRAAPDTLGLNTEALDAHLERCRRSQAFGCLVAYRGHVVQEWYREEPHSPFVGTRSAVKSWIGLLAGMVVSDGAIDSLGVPVARYIPEWTAGARAGVTVEHLLTMRSGLRDRTGAELTVPRPDSSAGPPPEGPGVVAADNTTAFALDTELDFEPGERFSYSNEGVQLLSLLLKRASGMRLSRYAHERLFAPLGMDRTRLRVDAYGNTVGFGGAETTLSEFARIGQLVANEGRWNGEQVVPAAWIERATSPVATPNYGFLWWVDRKRDNVAATGSLDNVCIVFPEHDLVAVRMQRDPQPDAAVRYQSTKTLELLRDIVAP